MVNCPECDAAIDVEADDVDEGDLLTCDECGAELRVAGTEPLEIESVDDVDDEDEDDNFFDDDEDEEEQAEDDWK